ncbi:glucose PTS transporter subunit EIIB, partial [Citrobacter freundii]|uniref:glucose PTS transporter subunit EIIB n=1 Tax=Citrobacter freundii TaxID=546 RepID=UPI003879E3CB
KNSLNRLIRCVCGKKIGPDPRNFNQRVSLGRNDLLIRTFPNTKARGKSKYDHGVILNALGGKENIDSLDNCITRLRLVVKDMSKVDQQTLKSAGALSVVVLDAHSVQVIIGPQVQSVKTGIEALI